MKGKEVIGAPEMPEKQERGRDMGLRMKGIVNHQTPPKKVNPS